MTNSQTTAPTMSTTTTALPVWVTPDAAAAATASVAAIAVATATAAATAAATGAASSLSVSESHDGDPLKASVSRQTSILLGSASGGPTSQGPTIKTAFTRSASCDTGCDDDGEDDDESSQHKAWKVVNSRHSVMEWRSDDALSGGASEAMIHHVRQRQQQRRRQSQQNGALAGGTLGASSIESNNSPPPQTTDSPLPGKNQDLLLASANSSNSSLGRGTTTTTTSTTGSLGHLKRRPPMEPIRRRQSDNECVSRSYISSLMEDLQWAFSELDYPVEGICNNNHDPNEDVNWTEIAVTASVDDLDNNDDANNSNNIDDELDTDQSKVLPASEQQQQQPQLDRTSGMTITAKQIEAWAVLVHNTLTRESRHYHGMSHIFEICASAAPIQLLAAVFRDMILRHGHIDRDEPATVTEQSLLDGILLERQKLDTAMGHPTTAYILSSALPEPGDLIVADIFGFAPGMDLTSFQGLHKGLDAFLSAMVASRLLRQTPLMRLSTIAQIVACIEATIPFRCNQTMATKTDEGDGPVTIKTPLDVLYDRLERCNVKYNLGFTKEDMIETVQLGADLHNRSMGNMSGDVAEFLDHTWNLLPEHCAALRRHCLYTLSDYCTAIRGMVKVLQGLKVESVYRSFHGIPMADEMKELQGCLARNLAVSIEYCQVRLLSGTVVAALAFLTGGDAPKAFFFGDAPVTSSMSTGDGVSHRLGDRLVNIGSTQMNQFVAPTGSSTQSNPVIVDKDSVSYRVMQALRGENMSETGFDTKYAPLSTYLYRTIPAGSLPAILDLVCDPSRICFPMTKTSAKNVLKTLSLEVVQTVAQELAWITVSRAKPLEQVIQRLTAKRQQQMKEQQELEAKDFTIP